jgi:hypothetical protein
LELILSTSIIVFLVSCIVCYIQEHCHPSKTAP